MLLHLAGQQEAAGDVAFFRFKVAVELDDFHAVKQRHRDGVQRVGRGDKEDLGKIILQIKVVIHEGIVLFRVEHFQQGRGGVATVVGGHLVHFVQAEEGIVELHPLEGLDDLARQRAHIGAAVPPDFGLVAHAAKGEAHKIAPCGAGHGLGKGGFTHAGGADKAEDGAFEPLGKLLHGKVFQNAFLGLFKAKVVAVQNCARLFKVDVYLLEVVPGQIQNPVHIVAHNRVFRRRGRHAAQLSGFGERLFARFFRHVPGLELLLYFVNFGLGVVIAPHFLVDGLDLLIEVIFALVALHLHLDAVLDALFNRGKGHLALQKLIGKLKALGGVVDLKGFLLFAVINLEVRDDGIGQRADFLQGKNGEHGLLRNLFVVLAVFFKRLVHGAHQSLALFGAALLFGAAAHAHHGALLVFVQVFPSGAIYAFKQHLDGAVGQAQHLKHLADHAYRRKILSIGLFQLRLALGHKKYLLAVGGLCGFDGLDGGLAPHKERHDGAGEHDHLAQRHDGQFNISVRAAHFVCHNSPLKKKPDGGLRRPAELRAFLP